MVYLAQVKHLASYKSRVCEVDAWTELYGRLRRVQITAENVRTARAGWIADGYTPKTCNNRFQTLRHLYRVLDGPGHRHLLTMFRHCQWQTRLKCWLLPRRFARWRQTYRTRRSGHGSW